MEKIEQKFYSASDLMTMLNCKKSKAYRLIRKLNDELEEKGIKTIQGRILKSYFDQLYGIEK